ncbi:MAG: hypothetical protein Q4Q17_01100 [Tissierellia bacterium]|nr:hypothetical protein [Tissierellia bacterium]
MYASDYMEDKILKIFSGVTFSAPAKVYLGLFLSSPGESGREGTEVSYTGYQRQEITFSVPAPESNGMGIRNTEKIDFSKAETSVGTITYVGIFDSVSGGNMLAYSRIAEAMVVGESDAPTFLPGEVIFYLTGDLSKSFQEKILNVFRGISLAGVNSHLALYNGDPDSGGAELTGGGYARLPLMFSTPSNSSSGATTIVNTNDGVFPRPTGSWGTWNYNVIMSEKSGGEPLYKKSRSPREIKKGYMPMLEAEDISLSIN